MTSKCVKSLGRKKGKRITVRKHPKFGHPDRFWPMAPSRGTRTIRGSRWLPVLGFCSSVFWWFGLCRDMRVACFCFFGGPPNVVGFLLVPWGKNNNNHPDKKAQTHLIFAGLKHILDPFKVTFLKWWDVLRENIENPVKTGFLTVVHHAGFWRSSTMKNGRGWP